MSYKIKTIPQFEKDVKKLKKKFPKIKNDIALLVKELYENPKKGIHLGENIYKIRIANSSIPIGKSGGFRVITYYIENETLYLIMMYSKSSQENIMVEKLKEIIKQQISNA